MELNIYRKRIREKELFFLKEAEKLNVTPKIINVTPCDDESILEQQRYPCTLFNIDIKDREKYISPITALIKRLHENGIVHGDIHEENIVIDDNDVKLIDFGFSKYIKDITVKDIIDGMYDYDGELKTIEDFINAEINEVKFICTKH
jgi:tRNA A-37 threonylcarbamoyl transferase component Bud32